MIKHLILIALVMSVVGCNTIHGMGQDIEKAGEAVQKTTK